MEENANLISFPLLIIFVNQSSVNQSQDLIIRLLLDIGELWIG